MKQREKQRDMILISMFVALISVGAYIKVPIPVCPFTLQFFFTTLAGIVLGGRKGAISVAVYILLGLIGVPVFTSGGGLGYVFVPTFGYLLGFCAGTFVTGKISNSGELTLKRLLTAGFSGLMIVYAAGMIYYWLINKFYLGTPIGIAPLFLYCFVLAVPGDIALCILSAVLGKRLVPIVKRDLRRI